MPENDIEGLTLGTYPMREAFATAEILKKLCVERIDAAGMTNWEAYEKKTGIKDRTLRSLIGKDKKPKKRQTETILQIARFLELKNPRDLVDEERERSSTATADEGKPSNQEAGLNADDKNRKHATGINEDDKSVTIKSKLNISLENLLVIILDSEDIEVCELDADYILKAKKGRPLETLLQRSLSNEQKESISRLTNLFDERGNLERITLPKPVAVSIFRRIGSGEMSETDLRTVFALAKILNQLPSELVKQTHKSHAIIKNYEDFYHQS